MKISIRACSGKLKLCKLLIILPLCNYHRNVGMLSVYQGVSFIYHLHLGHLVFKTNKNHSDQRLSINLIASYSDVDIMKNLVTLSWNC